MILSNRRHFLWETVQLLFPWLNSMCAGYRDQAIELLFGQLSDVLYLLLHMVQWCLALSPTGKVYKSIRDVILWGLARVVGIYSPIFFLSFLGIYPASLQHDCMMVPLKHPITVCDLSWIWQWAKWPHMTPWASWVLVQSRLLWLNPLAGPFWSLSSDSCSLCCGNSGPSALRQPSSCCCSIGSGAAFLHSACSSWL